jgi:hypothetical protein
MLYSTTCRLLEIEEQTAAAVLAIVYGAYPADLKIDANPKNQLTLIVYQFATKTLQLSPLAAVQFCRCLSKKIEDLGNKIKKLIASLTTDQDAIERLALIAELAGEQLTVIQSSAGHCCEWFTWSGNEGFYTLRGLGQPQLVREIPGDPMIVRTLAFWPSFVRLGELNGRNSPSGSSESQRTASDSSAVDGS